MHCFYFDVRFVYLIFSLGTGMAKCKRRNPVDVDSMNDIIATRNTQSATLEVNGNVTSCKSRGAASALNVEQVFYLGGVPDLAQVQASAYENTKDLRDFTGCVHHLKVRLGFRIPMPKFPYPTAWITDIRDPCLVFRSHCP